MDCRSSLVIVLGLGCLAGLAGCKTTDPSQASQPDNQPVPLSQLPTDAKITKAKDLPKRAPKADTCVAFGDFRLREAESDAKTAGEQKQYRQQARQAYQQALQIDPKCAAA